MKKYAFLLAVLALLLVVGTALAQPQADEFELSRTRVDNGYGTWKSADGEYELTGTIGQPEGGAVLSGEGGFEFIGGYWMGGISGLIQRLLYLPFVTG